MMTFRVTLRNGYADITTTDLVHFYWKNIECKLFSHNGELIAIQIAGQTRRVNGVICTNTGV